MQCTGYTDWRENSIIFILIEELRNILKYFIANWEAEGGRYCQYFDIKLKLKWGTKKQTFEIKFKQLN